MKSSCIGTAGPREEMCGKCFKNYEMATNRRLQAVGGPPDRGGGARWQVRQDPNRAHHSHQDRGGETAEHAWASGPPSRSGQI